MIIRQTDELKHLVNEFSNFARLPQTKPVLASLHQVCVDVLDMYRAAHRDVSFEFETEGQAPDFRFDPEQIRRVLINLIDNAVAAVQQQPSPKVILRLQYDASLKLVRLMIIDNGPGIPAADRDRVFEPYFSTKESGTGLGLAIVRRIIEDHNGFVRALANESQGAKLLLELPVNEVSEPTGAERVR
jgi:two-component system nitrogen regulation sensor histidine kinase NtrY